ncbi:prenylcysteine oxidase 1, partial [Hyalella azteca]|uniref:Prenylcysteine oxidase 1 n=1 Tax=Hyalella azteca TaxID=294128 RepID=A0A8B7PA50_HYAAZ
GLTPHNILQLRSFSAIIGGGVGGAAAAYFLQELTGGNALIDVYESGYVGGRLATTDLGGSYYEMGGSVIHPSNAYMGDFIKTLGLEKRMECPSLAGLFDGSSFVFRDSSWQVVTLAKLFWRYGWSIYTLRAANQQMLDQFNRIYKLQKKGQAFTNGEQLLEAMSPSFPAMLHMSTREHLLQLGISQAIIDEVVMAVTLANYGQTPDVHAFVGAISVAAASPDLWSVKGGNKQVPELLLGKARASLLRRHVTDVTVISRSLPLSLFQVDSVEATEASDSLQREGRNDIYSSAHVQADVRSQPYDAVIVAAPLTHDKTDIKFHNVTHNYNFPGRYERIVATLVRGKLRKETFGLSKDDSLDEIFPVNPDLFYNAVGLLKDVNVEKCSDAHMPDVFKVFSPAHVTEEQLNLLFDEIYESKVFDWRAFPHYNISEPHFTEFELEPGLYYLNAIEWLGSAMEMSAIAAKNVALLAFKHLTHDSSAGSLVETKDEL